MNIGKRELGVLGFKSFVVLPLAALSAAALAQTVNYGVPIFGPSAVPNSVTLSGTRVITTTGCLPPHTGLNDSTTSPIVEPGSVIQTPFDGSFALYEPNINPPSRNCVCGGYRALRLRSPTWQTA